MEKEKKYIILIVETLIIAGMLCLVKFIPSTGIKGIDIVLNISYNLIMGITAFIACKLTGIKIDFEWKNYKQFIIGFGIASLLALALGVIPAACGGSLAGPHQNFKIWNFLFNLFYLLLIIGPVEEMIFRMYYQNTFISFFKKYKWIGIIIASIIFGLFHIFNGWISVLITFGIGLIFGFSKEYIKDIHYPGISFAHGLYDLFFRVITYIF